MLEVNRREAARVQPAQMLAQYRRDKFTGAAAQDPAVFDLQAFSVLSAKG